jgi:hypothetical protein
MVSKTLCAVLAFASLFQSAVGRSCLSPGSCENVTDRILLQRKSISKHEQQQMPGFGGPPGYEQGPSPNLSSQEWQVVFTEQPGTANGPEYDMSQARLLNFRDWAFAIDVTGQLPYEVKLEWPGGWVQFTVPHGYNIFDQTMNQNIPIQDVKKSSDYLPALGATGYFCHACVGWQWRAQDWGVRWGDTCWAVLPLSDHNRSCGCNNGNATGSGIYYGGSKNQDRCHGRGGGFAGPKLNKQQRGNLKSIGLKFSVKLAITLVSNAMTCYDSTNWLGFLPFNDNYDCEQKCLGLGYSFYVRGFNNALPNGPDGIENNCKCCDTGFRPVTDAAGFNDMIFQTSVYVVRNTACAPCSAVFSPGYAPGYGDTQGATQTISQMDTWVYTIQGVSSIIISGKGCALLAQTTDGVQSYVYTEGVYNCGTLPDGSPSPQTCLPTGNDNMVKAMMFCGSTTSTTTIAVTTTTSSTTRTTWASTTTSATAYSLVATDTDCDAKTASIGMLGTQECAQNCGQQGYTFFTSDPDNNCMCCWNGFAPVSASNINLYVITVVRTPCGKCSAVFSAGYAPGYGDTQGPTMTTTQMDKWIDTSGVGGVSSLIISGSYCQLLVQTIDGLQTFPYTEGVYNCGTLPDGSPSPQTCLPTGNDNMVKAMLYCQGR